MEDRDLCHHLEALLVQMVAQAVKEYFKKRLEPMLWQIELVRRGVSVRDEHFIGGRFLLMFRLMIYEQFGMMIDPPAEDRMTLGEVLQIMQEELAG